MRIKKSDFLEKSDFSNLSVPPKNVAKKSDFLEKSDFSNLSVPPKNGS
jgi:hypothetical protein